MMVRLNVGDIRHALITVVCSLAFIWQLVAVAREWFIPTHSAMAVEEKDLDMRDFPVVFKICPNPGFNLNSLNEEGYRLIQHYFEGKSMYNSSQYGWAGHYNGYSKNHTVTGKAKN